MDGHPESATDYRKLVATGVQQAKSESQKNRLVKISTTPFGRPENKDRPL